MIRRWLTVNGATSAMHPKDFVEYTDATSWLRVLCVCSLAFSPTFALTVLIELLPLRPPTDGWKANWVYWIRIYFSSGLVSIGSAVQFIMVVPACGLSMKHAFYIGIITPIGYLLSNLVLAQTWRFPIPFTVSIMAPIWFVSLYTCTFCAIGKRRFEENPEILKQLKAAVRILSAQSLLVVVYPIYNAIFVQLEGIPQILFILLLPLIKHFMNLLFNRLSVEVPTAKVYTVVSVKLFDALYMFKCMGSAGSLVSGIVLITLDLLQNMYHFKKLHNRVRKLRQCWAESNIHFDYKATIQKSLSRVASWSCSNVHLRSNEASIFTKNTIAPCPPSATDALPQNDESLNQLDEEVQGLLLESERIILVEFIECAVPMFYAVYLVVLFHLPNAKYYPETEHQNVMKLVRTVSNIAAYATAEFASLLYVHFFLRWKLDISALHMLAYVLERDNAILQSVFMSWVIVVLQWTLRHGCTLPYFL